MAQLQIIAEDGNITGESPIWDAREERLIWSDIDGGVMYEYKPATQFKRILSQGICISGIALADGGGLILGMGNGLHRWTPEDGFLKVIGECDGQALCVNDILAGPHGQIYAGTYFWSENGMEKTGALYMIESNGRASVMDEGIRLANGLALSPDDRTLYFADSAVRRIYAYDVDPTTGKLSNRRIFVEVPGDEGIPDGMTTDSEGFLWSAQWYGSQVVRYDPDGRVERRIGLPVTQVSSVAFGGGDYEELYITSAGGPWPSDLAPPGYDFDARNVGGSLYRLIPGVTGKPEHVARVSAQG